MDKNESRKDPSEDVTRESLISISYGVPEKGTTAEKSTNNNTGGEKVSRPLKHDGDEKYRSELISISDSPSPDVKALPTLPG